MKREELDGDRSFRDIKDQLHFLDKQISMLQLKVGLTPQGEVNNGLFGKIDIIFKELDSTKERIQELKESTDKALEGNVTLNKLKGWLIGLVGVVGASLVLLDWLLALKS